MEPGFCPRMLAAICHSFIVYYMWQHAVYAGLAASALASAMVLTDLTQYHLWNTVCCGIGFATLLNNAVTYMFQLHDT
eukprot:12885274-Prorocentrum_lima.AAC.1